MTTIFMDVRTFVLTSQRDDRKKETRDLGMGGQAALPKTKIPSLSKRFFPTQMIQIGKG
jgi:hypothetical protein